MIKNPLINRPRVWLMRTSPRLYVRLARLAARGMFRRERRALAGQCRPRVEEPSVLHFCYNRCGSRYVSQLIQRLLEPRGHLFVDYDRYHAHCDRDGLERFADPEFLNPRIHRQGMHYGPFYRLHEGFTDLDGFRIILTLRDPRDVLTSRFFSQAFAHTLFDEASIERRERFRAMGVDAFVLDQAGELIERYTSYHHGLMGRENVLFLRYEDMVNDFEGWLRRLAGFIGSGGEGEVLRALLEEADFSVKKEDKFSHRRSVKPGNYLRKLQPDTVVALNERLAPVLEWFGYAAEDGIADGKER